MNDAIGERRIGGAAVAAAPRLRWERIFFTTTLLFAGLAAFLFVAATRVIATEAYNAWYPFAIRSNTAQAHPWLTNVTQDYGWAILLGFLGIAGLLLLVVAAPWIRAKREEALQE